VPDASIIIGGFALVVSIGTLIHGAFTLSGMAKKSSIDDLNDALERLQKERDEWRDHAEECERERQWLRREYMEWQRHRPPDQRRLPPHDG